MKTTLHRILPLIGIMLLWSCNAQGNQAGADNSGADTPNVANYDFLTRLGINLDGVVDIGNSFDGGSDAEAPSLTRAQGPALLGSVVAELRDTTAEADVPGNFFITGVKPMAARHTMVVYLFEHGDGSSQRIAIYDSNGQLTDYIDPGSWSDFGIEEADMDMTSGTAYKTTGSMTAITDNGFTVKRTMEYVQWKLDPAKKQEYSNEDLKTDRTLWRIDKTYVYTLDRQGHLQAKPAKVETTGNPDRNTIRQDEVNDAVMLPVSDSRRFDALNALAASDEAAADAQEDGPLTYRLQIAVWNMFETTPLDLLNYLAAHRNSRLTPIFEALFSKGYIAKERLIDQLRAMPAGEARDYLDRLTAQWGPADAVG